MDAALCFLKLQMKQHKDGLPAPEAAAWAIDAEGLIELVKDTAKKFDSLDNFMLAHPRFDELVLAEDPGSCLPLKARAPFYIDIDFIKLHFADFMASLRSSWKEVAARKTEDLLKTLPKSSLFGSGAILSNTNLQQEVFSIDFRAISASLTSLKELRSNMEQASSDLRIEILGKEAVAAMKVAEADAKQSIGMEFALRKYLELQGADDSTVPSVVQETLHKLQQKKITLKPFMLVALRKLAQVAASKSPAKSGGARSAAGSSAASDAA